jgi:hypothetical protein
VVTELSTRQNIGEQAAEHPRAFPNDAVGPPTLHCTLYVVLGRESIESVMQVRLYGYSDTPQLRCTSGVNFVYVFQKLLFDITQHALPTKQAS